MWKCNRGSNSNIYVFLVFVNLAPVYHMKRIEFRFEPMIYKYALLWTLNRVLRYIHYSITIDSYHTFKNIRLRRFLKLHIIYKTGTYPTTTTGITWVFHNSFCWRIHRLPFLYQSYHLSAEPGPVLTNNRNTRWVCMKYSMPWNVKNTEIIP